ncbi:MAG: PEP-CTERM sorting domain-containing protein [Planctomycetes bacterium]|nr:PEP-CTERM sorting domain-containing protein [Planctomycetota bacterium]
MVSKRVMILMVVLTISTCAMATPVYYDSQWVDIEGEVGTGSCETIIVIDWEYGVTESHAWLYKWNTSVVVSDAYDTIMGVFSTFAWSQTAFVDYINYNDGIDNHQTINTGWLSFWNKDSGNWAMNGEGVYAQALLDGGWSGAIADDYPDWGDVAPTVPTPEPATIMLLGIGGLLFRRK